MRRALAGRVRRRPLARGGRGHRRRALGRARHAAPLRHALEPAAAADRTSRSAARAVLRWIFERIERVGDAPLEGRHRDLPGAAATRAGTPAWRRAVLIENAPGSGRRSRRRRRLPRRAPPSASRRPRRSSLYTGTFEAYQGLDLLFAAAGARRCEPAPTRGCCSPAGRPEQVDAARAQARGRRHRRRDRSSRASGRPTRSRHSSKRPTCSCRRGAAARTRR